MEIKEYPNRIVIYVDSEGHSIPDHEKQQISKLGRLLSDNGIQYTEGKSETLRVCESQGFKSFRHVLHIHFDDVNFTAYKIIKD